MSNELDNTASSKELVKIIEKVRSECVDGLEKLKTQIEELRSSISDNNKRLARLIKLIDDAQQTILIVEHAASELNSRIVINERKADNAQNSAIINKQNLTVINNYAKGLARQFASMRNEVAALKDEVEAHSGWWKYLIIGASVVTGIVGMVIWVVHEYVGWVHLIQILGAE